MAAAAVAAVAAVGFVSPLGGQYVKVISLEGGELLVVAGDVQGGQGAQIVVVTGGTAVVTTE